MIYSGKDRGLTNLRDPTQPFNNDLVIAVPLPEQYIDGAHAGSVTRAVQVAKRSGLAESSLHSGKLQYALYASAGCWGVRNFSLHHCIYYSAGGQSIVMYTGRALPTTGLEYIII